LIIKVEPQYTVSTFFFVLKKDIFFEEDFDSKMMEWMMKWRVVGILVSVVLIFVSMSMMLDPATMGILLSVVLIFASMVLDPATMLLVYAIRNKHPKTASFALRKLGANPNEVISEGTKTREISILSISILVFSSFETDLVFVLSELLRAGADPSYQDSLGLTALHYACRFLVPSSAIKLLLNRSPHLLNITTNEFETAFHYAIDQHHQWECVLDVVRVLLKYGADPNKASGVQQTPPLVINHYSYTLSVVRSL
jgi:hypothetical protein